MDPDKIMSRNDGFDGEYEPVGVFSIEDSAQLLRHRRKDVPWTTIRKKIGLRHVPLIAAWIGITTLVYYFGISMILESLNDSYEQGTCRVVRAEGPIPYASNTWVCQLWVTFGNLSKEYELVDTPAIATHCQLYGIECDYNVAGDCQGECWYVPSLDEVHTTNAEGPRLAGILLLVIGTVVCFCVGYGTRASIIN